MQIIILSYDTASAVQINSTTCRIGQRLHLNLGNARKDTPLILQVPKSAFSENDVPIVKQKDSKYASRLLIH